MKKSYLAVFLLFLSSLVFSNTKNREEISAYSILKNLSSWEQKIDSFSISFSLSYKSSDMKIQKVERRGYSFIKRRQEFSHFRYDLIHPEKLSFLVTPYKFLKFNISDKQIEEESIFSQMPKQGEFAANKEISANKEIDLRKTNKKAKEQFSGVVFIGATIPEDFKAYSVYKNAFIENEIIYKNKPCVIITAKLSNKKGRFWVTKDKNNLLKYVLTAENNFVEEVEVVKMKKFFDSIYIPIEVIKKNIDATGKLVETIHIKYYGYSVNRKLPLKTFEL